MHCECPFTRETLVLSDLGRMYKVRQVRTLPSADAAWGASRIPRLAGRRALSDLGRMHAPGPGRPHTCRLAPSIVSSLKLATDIQLLAPRGPRWIDRALADSLLAVTAPPKLHATGKKYGVKGRLDQINRPSEFAVKASSCLSIYHPCRNPSPLLGLGLRDSRVYVEELRQGLGFKGVQCGRQSAPLEIPLRLGLNRA